MDLRITRPIIPSLIVGLLIACASVAFAQSSALDPKYFSCSFDDVSVKKALENSPNEMTKLGAERVDRRVSVTCAQSNSKNPEVVEYEFVFETCKGCPSRMGYLFVTEVRPFGRPVSYDAYLRID